MSSLPVLNCDGCGACCAEQAGLPASWYVAPSGPMGGTASGKRVPAALLAELRATVAGWLAHGFPRDGTPCIWYDAGAKRCRHYEYRPDLCRDGVRVGDEACREWRRRKGVT